MRISLDARQLLPPANKRSYGKVMFLHLCDSIHWGGGGGWGSLLRGGGLCQGGTLVSWVSVQEGGLYPRGFLSKEVSVQWRSLSGASVWGISVGGGGVYGKERAVCILLECILVSNKVKKIQSNCQLS